VSVWIRGGLDKEEKFAILIKLNTNVKYMEKNTVVDQEEKSIVKKMSPNSFLIAGSILVAGLVMAGSIFVGSDKIAQEVKKIVLLAPKGDATGAQQQPADPEVTMDQVQALFNGKNITFGKKNAKVVFVEFSDPSCPFCHVAAGKNPNLNKQSPQFTLVSDGGKYLAPVPEMKKLVDAGKASFVWLYTSGHGNGEMGTKALYCGFEKKKFWEVHDLLMSEAGYNMMNNDVKNDKAKAGVVAEFLKGVVKQSDMQACLESGKYDGRMTEDTAIATTFGISGTPKFFVNTEAFKGAISFTDMQPVVDKYLK